MNVSFPDQQSAGSQTIPTRLATLARSHGQYVAGYEARLVPRPYLARLGTRLRSTLVASPAREIVNLALIYARVGVSSLGLNLYRVYCFNVV